LTQSAIFESSSCGCMVTTVLGPCIALLKPFSHWIPPFSPRPQSQPPPRNPSPRLRYPLTGWKASTQPAVSPTISTPPPGRANGSARLRPRAAQGGLLCPRRHPPRSCLACLQGGRRQSTASRVRIAKSFQMRRNTDGILFKPLLRESIWECCWSTASDLRVFSFSFASSPHPPW
jgi:hypothetical protein